MKLAWHGDRIEFIHVRFKLADEGSAPLSTVLERSLPPLSLISLRSFLLPIGLRFLLGPVRPAPDTTRRFFVFVQNRAANVGTNCMPSRACHSCILCADRTLCRSAPGPEFVPDGEVRGSQGRASTGRVTETWRIPRDSWNARFALRHPRIIYVFRVPSRNCPTIYFSSFVIEKTILVYVSRIRQGILTDNYFRIFVSSGFVLFLSMNEIIFRDEAYSKHIEESTE